MYGSYPNLNYWPDNHYMRPRLESPWFEDINDAIGSLRKSRHELDKMANDISQLGSYSRPMTPHYPSVHHYDSRPASSYRLDEIPTRNYSPANLLYDSPNEYSADERYPTDKIIENSSIRNDSQPVKPTKDMDTILKDFQDLLSRELETVKKENDALRVSNMEIQDDLHSKTVQLDQIHPKYLQLEADLIGANQYVKDLMTNLDNLEDEKGQMEVKSALQNDELKDKSSQIERLQEEKRQGQLEQQELQLKFESAVAEQKRILSDLKDLEGEHTEVKEINSQLRDDCEELTNQLALAQKELDRLRNQMRDTRMDLLDGKATEHEQYLAELLKLRKIADDNTPRFDVSVQTDFNIEAHRKSYPQETDSIITPHTNRQLAAARSDRVDFQNSTNPEFDQEKEMLKEAYSSLQSELLSIKESIYNYREEHRKETEVYIKENEALKRQILALKSGQNPTQVDLPIERESLMNRKLSGSSGSLSKAEQRTERRYIREEKHLNRTITTLQKDNLGLKDKCKKLEELLNQQETDSTLNSDLESLNLLPSSSTPANKHIDQIKDHLSESQLLLAKQSQLIDLLDQNPTGPLTFNNDSVPSTKKSAPVTLSPSSTPSRPAFSQTEHVIIDKALPPENQPSPTRERSNASNYTNDSEVILKLTNEIVALNQSLKEREQSFDLLTEKTERFDKLSCDTSRELEALRKHLCRLQENGDSVARNTEDLQKNFHTFSGNWTTWSAEISQEFTSCDDRISRVESTVNELSQRMNAQPVALLPTATPHEFDVKVFSPTQQLSEDNSYLKTAGRKLPDIPNSSTEIIKESPLSSATEFNKLLNKKDDRNQDASSKETTNTEQHMPVGEEEVVKSPKSIKKYSRKLSRDRDDEFSSDSIDDSAALKSSLQKEIDRINRRASVNGNSFSEDSDSNPIETDPLQSGASIREKEDSEDVGETQPQLKPVESILKPSAKLDSTDANFDKKDYQDLFSKISGSSALDLLDVRRSKSRPTKIDNPISDEGSESADSMVIIDDQELAVEEEIIGRDESSRLRSQPNSTELPRNSSLNQDDSLKQTSNDIDKWVSPCETSPNASMGLTFEIPAKKTETETDSPNKQTSDHDEVSPEVSDRPVFQPSSSVTNGPLRRSSDRSVRFEPEPEIYYKTPSETETEIETEETETESSSSPEVLPDEDDWLAAAEKQLRELNSDDSDPGCGAPPVPSKRFVDNKGGVLNLADYLFSESEESKSNNTLSEETNKIQSEQNKVPIEKEKLSSSDRNQKEDELYSDEFDDFTTSMSGTMSSEQSYIYRRPRKYEPIPIVSREKSSAPNEDRAGVKPPAETNVIPNIIDLIQSPESPSKRKGLHLDNNKLSDIGLTNKSKDSGFGENSGTWNSSLPSVSDGEDISDEQQSDPDSLSYANLINPRNVRPRNIGKLHLGLSSQSKDNIDQASSNSPSDIDQYDDQSHRKQKFFQDDIHQQPNEEHPPIPPVRKKRSSTQSPIPLDDVSENETSKPNVEEAYTNFMRSKDLFPMSPFGDLEKVPEEPEVITDMSDEVMSGEELDERILTVRDTMRTPTPFDPVCSRDDSTATESDNEDKHPAASSQGNGTSPGAANKSYFYHEAGYFDGEKFVDPNFVTTELNQLKTGSLRDLPVSNKMNNKEADDDKDEERVCLSEPDSVSSVEDQHHVFNRRPASQEKNTRIRNETNLADNVPKMHQHFENQSDLEFETSPHKDREIFRGEKEKKQQLHREFPNLSRRNEELSPRASSPVPSPRSSLLMSKPNEYTNFSDSDNDKKSKGSLLPSRQILGSSGGSVESVTNRGTPMLELESSFENIYDPGVTPRKHPAIKLTMEDEDNSYLTDTSCSSIADDGPRRPSNIHPTWLSSKEDAVDFETDASSTKSESPVATPTGHNHRFLLTEDFLPPISKQEDKTPDSE